MLGFSVFVVNKALATKLIVFPTVFIPACNKKHIGVTTGCKINGVLVTQNMSHGPANTGITWEGFAFVFLRNTEKKKETQTPRPLLRPAELKTSF